MKIEKSNFNTSSGNVCLMREMYRVQSKKIWGPWSFTKLEAVLSWSIARFGIGISDGNIYDDDGVHQHRVFAVQTHKLSGRFAETKLGAVAKFLFRPRHRI